LKVARQSHSGQTSPGAISELLNGHSVCDMRCRLVALKRVGLQRI
jgi:hypothetical protein